MKKRLQRGDILAIVFLATFCAFVLSFLLVQRPVNWGLHAHWICTNAVSQPVCIHNISPQ
jgi:hypothetical protein